MAEQRRASKTRGSSEERKTGLQDLQDKRSPETATWFSQDLLPILSHLVPSCESRHPVSGCHLAGDSPRSHIGRME